MELELTNEQKKNLEEVLAEETRRMKPREKEKYLELVADYILLKNENYKERKRP